ncbi:hypothetical protein ACTXT7_005760 [Hymenolepis weldensis]
MEKRLKTEKKKSIELNLIFLPPGRMPRYGIAIRHDFCMIFNLRYLHSKNKRKEPARSTLLD